MQRLERREEFISNSRHKPVFHLRNENEFFVLINPHDQRIESTCAGNVTSDDKPC